MVAPSLSSRLPHTHARTHTCALPHIHAHLLTRFRTHIHPCTHPLRTLVLRYAQHSTPQPSAAQRSTAQPACTAWWGVARYTNGRRNGRGRFRACVCIHMHVRVAHTRSVRAIRGACVCACVRACMPTRAHARACVPAHVCSRGCPNAIVRAHGLGWTSR